MSNAPTFGRRTARAATVTASPRPARDLPTLKDLGFTRSTAEDEELRAWKSAYRKRWFSKVGGWRWAAGVCGLAGTLCFFLNLGPLRAVFALAAMGLFILSFTPLGRPARPDPEPPETA